MTLTNTHKVHTVYRVPTDGIGDDMMKLNLSLYFLSRQGHFRMNESTDTLVVDVRWTWEHECIYHQGRSSK